MTADLTRDSVCAGDDGDAPHERRIDLPMNLTIEQLVLDVLAAYPLPSIEGGRATWCVSSNLPLAVIAQEWDGPRFLHMIPPRPSELNRTPTGVRMHFCYFEQQDPETVFAVLKRLRLRA